jgi:type I restriction enzyme S subunit
MRKDWTETSLNEILERSIGGVWGSEPGTDQEDVLVVRSTEFTKSGFLNFDTGVKRSIKTSQLSSRELREGDILLEKSGGGPEQPVGRVVFVESDIPSKTVCSNFIQLLTPSIDVAVPRFIFFLMWMWHSQNKTLEYQAQTTGIRNLRTPDYLEQVVLLPPLAEQKRIVDLVASVDAYIDALQKQADSAREARNAVLQELLSAGGDDWTETTIGEEAVVNPKETALAEDAPFVPMDAVKVGKRFVDYFEPRGERSGARARSGDVLFARITPCLENGKVAQIQDGVGACGGSTEFIVMRGSKTIDSDFIYFWATLRSTRDLAAGLMTGTTGRQRLSAKDLGEISLNLPPLDEQKRIVEIVSSMDEVIQSTEQAVVDAKALRSGLLSDLLSGNHEIPASYDSLLGAA